MKNPTIKDLAKIAGVSHTTVSRAINGSPLISEKRRKEIVKIAKKHNYTPNMMARGLTNKRSFTIGVILNFFGNPFIKGIMEGVEDIAEKNNYTMLFGDHREDEKRETRYIKTFIDRGVDGLLIYPVTARKATQKIDILRQSGIPYVMINHQPENTNSDIVSSDHFKAGFIATEHLLKRHHRHIGIIAGRGIHIKSDIVQGYQAALKQYGLACEKNYLQISGHSLLDAVDIAKSTLDFLKTNPQITGLFIYADEIVPAIAKMLNENIIKVPGDLSLVGYGDMKTITAPFYDLTSVIYQTNLTGDQAMDLLLKKMHDKNDVKEKRIVPVDLYIGNSTSIIN